MTMRHLPLLLALAGPPLAIGLNSSLPALAQVSDAQQRAVNVARMRAERMNGGLSNYRAAKCMYNTSAGGGECLVSVDGGYTFVIPGGSPGWQEMDQSPTVETELIISTDGRTVLAEIYNGTPR